MYEQDKEQRFMNRYGEPCPFCNGKPAIGCRFDSKGNIYYYALCTRCGAKGAEIKGEQIKAKDTDGGISALALKSWNESSKFRKSRRKKM